MEKIRRVQGIANPIFVLVFALFTSLNAFAAEDSLVVAIQKAKTPAEKINVLLARAHQLVLDKKRLDALKFEFQGYQLARQYNNISLELKAMRMYGESLLNLNRLDSAAYYFNAGVDLAKKTGSKNDLGLDCLDMSSVHLQMDNIPKASEYAQQALEIFRSSGDTIGVRKAELYLGNIKTQEGEYDEALQYYLDALKDTSHVDVNWIYNNIGAIYIAKNQPEKALYYMNMLYKRAKRMHNYSDMAGAMENMGEGWLALKKYDSAISCLQRAIDYSHHVASDVYIALAACQNLSTVFERKNQPAIALKYYKLYSHVKDSINTKETANHVAELEEKYQAKEKEEKITLLNEQQAVKSAQLRQSRLQFYFAVGGLMALAVVVVIFFYISIKLRRLNNRLNEQKRVITLEKEKTEQLNTLKDKLFSILSHDLRSPLINTHSLLHLLRSGGMTEEKFDRMSGNLEQALQQNIHLLDNLLNWAVGQIKGMSLNRVNIDVQNLIEESIMDVSGLADKKHLQIVQESCVDTEAMADLSMCRLVLRNLLSNAIKYTPEGGRITVNCRTEDEFVRISVADTGIGIAPEILAELFNNTLNKSEPGTNAERGFGIGLSLCKEFIEKNGGSLQVETEVGKGSTFSFTIPAVSVLQS
jgi:signal transduction histidine kinase/Tfp pilus assembly protein PilF